MKHISSSLRPCLYFSVIRDVTKILICDSEHTCCEKGEFPDGEQQDIIQLGWCWLNLLTMEISPQKYFYVKPTRSRINDYCTELTGILPKHVKSAAPLAHVCRSLINNHGTKARPWMTWGFDMEYLKQECHDLNADFPFSESYFNAQDLASILLGFPLRTGLDEALRLLNMSFDGKRHSAPDDAFNTAKIVRTFCTQIQRMER